MLQAGVVPGEAFCDSCKQPSGIGSLWCHGLLHRKDWAPTEKQPSLELQASTNPPICRMGRIYRRGPQESPRRFWIQSGLLHLTQLSMLVRFLRFQIGGIGWVKVKRITLISFLDSKMTPIQQVSSEKSMWQDGILFSPYWFYWVENLLSILAEWISSSCFCHHICLRLFLMCKTCFHNKQQENYCKHVREALVVS